MPACYAHYRFGQKLLESLPPELRRYPRNFRQLFLVGLQGPDLFFYHNPVVKTRTVKLGSTLHRQTGKEFFNYACAAVSSDAAKAYLLGLLGHYCLDSLCHPFVHQHTDQGSISHVELETEFDRFLLKSDGVAAPHTFDMSPNISLTWGECVTAAAFFPQLKPEEMRTSVKRMASFRRLLATPKAKKRRFLGKLMTIPGGQLRHHLMHERRNTNCSHLNGELLALFDQALERYPVLLEQIMAHMERSTPLGAEFDPEFG